MTEPTERLASTWHEEVTYEWLLEPDAPGVLIHEGGTRSGKTFNIAIGIIEYLAETPGQWFSIVRATGPALKATVRRDVIGNLRAMGLYDESRHNRTDDVFTFGNGSVIEFFATEDDMKVHGRTRDHLWCNEANEIDLDVFDQLNLRTRHRVILDFNPSMREDHWIWTRYDADPDVLRYRSTYKDNPFLTEKQERKIRALKDQDDWKWQVYGLGMRGVPAESIYRDVKPLQQWPEDLDYVYGLDVGYNDPMSLCRIAVVDGEPKPYLYVWQLVHESYLRRNALIERMKDGLAVDKNRPIYCDHDPDLIAELHKAGFYAVPADKSRGSVKAGIDFVGRHAIRVGGDDPSVAERARNEWKAYRWKKVRGVIQDEPAHEDSHAPDSGRYPAFTHFDNPYANPIA